MSHLNLGGVQFADRKYGDALASFNAARKIEPTNWEPYYDIGLVYQSEGRLSDAILPFKIASQCSPGRDDADTRMGDCYMLLHDLTDARWAYRRALEKVPGDPTAAYDCGVVEIDSHDYEAALRDFSLAESRMRSDALVHAELASAWLKTGHMREAQSEATEALRLARGTGQMEQMVGQILRGRNGE
jgi:Flp pilus assembly protein TadD